MKKILLLLALFYFQFVNAQTIDKKEYTPTFPGGIDSMYAFIERNTNYSSLSKDSINEVKVMLRFAVMADGSIDKCKILSKTPKEFNEEALRVVKLMPKWEPGVMNGRPVSFYFTLPIVFKTD
jgi:protein TonB